jgi:hypothetical protein
MTAGAASAAALGGGGDGGKRGAAGERLQPATYPFKIFSPVHPQSVHPLHWASPAPPAHALAAATTSPRPWLDWGTWRESAAWSRGASEAGGARRAPPGAGAPSARYTLSTPGSAAASASSAPRASAALIVTADLGFVQQQQQQQPPWRDAALFSHQQASRQQASRQQASRQLTPRLGSAGSSPSKVGRPILRLRACSRLAPPARACLLHLASTVGFHPLAYISRRYLPAVYHSGLLCIPAGRFRQGCGGVVRGQAAAPAPDICAAAARQEGQPRRSPRGSAHDAVAAVSPTVSRVASRPTQHQLGEWGASDLSTGNIGYVVFKQPP